MAGSDYFQFIFVFDSNGFLTYKDTGYLSYKILDSVSVKIRESLEIEINGVSIYPGDCDFDINRCIIVTNVTEILFIDKYQFGFGGIIYYDDVFDFETSKNDLIKMLDRIYDFSNLKEISFYQDIISNSIDSLKTS
jgi:CO dehydrogenase/acetyl-CoA synthase epsilon subunit